MRMGAAVTDQIIERLAKLEAREEIRDQQMIDLMRKVDELHAALMGAKGIRWFLAGLVAVVGAALAWASAANGLFRQ